MFAEARLEAKACDIMISLAQPRKISHNDDTYTC